MLRKLVQGREVLVRIFASPPPVKPRPGGRVETAAVLGTAVAVGIWIFIFQMRRFLGLGTTSDLYVSVQLATTWLDGRFLQDNFFGHFLAVHACFFCLPLAVFAYPFGAPGLLFALGLAAALSVIALVKILRLLGVPGWLALAWAIMATIMPLSLHGYQNDMRGFDVDLLEPVMALWLTYFLLGRKWLGSMVVAVALISIKEDAPLIAIVVGIIVLCEDFIRSLGPGWRKGWNAPAAGVVLLGILAVPLLLFVLKTQQVEGASTNLLRVHPVQTTEIGSNGALLSYVTSHIGTWLRSPTVTGWLGLSLAATFGLIALRPHLLLAGVATTLVAWLVQDDLLWAPRWAPALAFFQIAGCLAFASFWQLGADSWSRRRGRSIAGVLVIVLGFGVGLGWRRQLQAVPQTAEVYRLDPHLAISSEDRQKADRLFGLYRREGRREEPVIASDYLFRYAHDRNLLWYGRLGGRPRAEWILWDKKGPTPLSTLVAFLRTDAGSDLSDYELRGQEAERFLLFKRRHTARKEGVWTPGPVVLAGEPDGPIRMNVQLAEKRAGMSEPVLSLGRKEEGELVFVRYLSETRMVLGVENTGMAVHLSQPLEYRPGLTYELEYFSGALLPEKSRAPEGAKEREVRLRYGNLERLRWNGREVLSVPVAQPPPVRADEIYVGYNQVQAGSARQVFAGEISDVRRTGDPAMPDQKFGAVRLMVQLPAHAAGIPEPLVVLGRTGEAVLGYVRVLPQGLIKVGAEFWGWNADESEPVPADSTKPVEVIFSFPALYPPVGDARWEEVPRSVQSRLRSSLRISVNGAPVLERDVTVPVPNVSNTVFGLNPVGGSLVSSAFTGRLLQVSRLPLAER